MKKLFVFVGDGGSGKTTLVSELVKRHPDKFKKVVTCTSRAMRPGEVDGEDYHFLPPNYFIGNPRLVLLKQTENGDYYGSKSADLRSETQSPLLTLRFAGIRKLANLGFENVAIVRISITEELKIQRMRRRGDTEEMIARRLKFDAEDKADIDWAQWGIIDLQATNTLDEKVDRVLKAW